MAKPIQTQAALALPGEPAPQARNRRLFVVVSYDIANDRRRYRVMKTLKNYGRRVQYSVFECDVDANAFITLRKQLDKLSAPREDSVRYYFLDEDAIKKIVVAGLGTVERMQPYVIVG